MVKCRDTPTECVIRKVGQPDKIKLHDDVLTDLSCVFSADVNEE